MAIFVALWSNLLTQLLAEKNFGHTNVWSLSLNFIFEVNLENSKSNRKSYLTSASCTSAEAKRRNVWMPSGSRWMKNLVSFQITSRRMIQVQIFRRQRQITTQGATFSFRQKWFGTGDIGTENIVTNNFAWKTSIYYTFFNVESLYQESLIFYRSRLKSYFFL